MGLPEIVIVSHGRADDVLTLKLFDPGQVKLSVAESQLAAYQGHYPDADYLVHPDSVKGLPAKRQWVFDQCGDVFMLDDDCVRVVSNATPAGEKGVSYRGDALVSIIQRTHDTAEEMGVKLYGLAPTMMPQQYNPMRPFRLTGLVFGHCMGMVEVGSKLWYDTGVKAVDDMWVSLLNVHHHRITLVDTRYSVQNELTARKTGGNATVRTRSTYVDDVKRLQDAFGATSVYFREEGVIGVNIILGDAK